MKLLNCLIVTLALSGCATCRQHPMACTVAVVGVVAAGAIAANLAQHDSHSRVIAPHIGDPACSAGPCQ